MGEPVRAGHASAEHASGDSTWVDPVPGPVATRRSSPASDGTQIPAWAGGPTGDGLTRAQPSSGTARIPAWAAPPKQERHSGADPAEADLVIGDIERASGLPFEFANIVQLREGTPGQQATAADRAFDRDAATEASADVLEHAATRFATGQPAQAPAHAADGFLPKLFAAGPAAEPVGELESALGSGGLGLGIELPAEHRARFEPQLDADLSGVRVHSGPAASRAAAARGARALTYGQHVVLGGNAVVDTPNGNELLAHELMHTVQQRTRTPSVLAAPKDENEMTTGPVTVRWWPKLGLLGATLNGIPWVTVRWEPSPARTTLNVQAKSVGSFGASVSGGSGPVLLPRPSLLGADGVGLRVQTRFPIKVLVNREAEARLAEGRTSPVRFVHEYSADGQRVEVNEELPQGSRSHEGTQFVSDTQDQAFDLLYNPEFGRAEQVPVRPTASSRPFAWRFGSRAQLEAWAAAHPDLWWVEGPPDGTTLQALHADEKRMAEVADQWRQQGGDTGVRTVYERGVAWPDLDSLYDLFYRTEYGAQEGPPGDAGECLVFRHNRASYGRVPLSHEEARAAWTQLETDETTGGMAGRIPRGSFMFVAARGQGTSVDLIGEQYLTLRARFFAGLEAKQDPADLLREPFMWSGFLRIALDRPMGGLDPALKRAFYMDSRLWDAAGASILADLSRDAKWEAIWAIDAAKQGVQIYANEEAAHRLVLTMAGMTSKERSNTAAFLGLEGQSASSVTTVLADREKAARVWMGETVDAVSTAGLVEAASSQSSKLERFQLQVENDDVEPLWVPGEFGDQIRARVYKKYGFTLSPASFPHEDTPDRLLAGGFGSELGFAFAHGAARESSSRRTRHLWLLVGSVVAGVVLVLVANAAGAAVAGLLFAEGTAGYVIVEVGISALVLTGASPATSTFILSGGKASAEAYAAAYGDPGEQYVWNVLTFGFFKALGAGVRALAVVGAGGEEAYAGSLAWKTAETGVRMGASGVAMYGIAGLQHRMHGKPMPTGTGRDELLFETGLSLVLMEVAGFAVRGPMKDLRDLVRDVRLGDKAPKIDTLLVEAQTLSKEVSAFAADPHTAGKRGQALLDRQVRLLESAKALIEELRATPRTGADIKDLQTRLDRFTAQIDAQLAAARGYALIGEANVRPVSFEEGNTEFTYDRTKQTQIEEFYTKAKAEVRSEGRTIFVTYQGKELVFRPATDTAAGIRPDGTRTPAAFDAWRAAVARRRAVLLDRAQERAHVDSDVEALRDADPAAMDEKVLSKAEGLLARVDRTLQKLGDPQPLGPIDKSGTDAEGWRLRLVEARRQLLARARVLGLLDEPEIVQLSPAGHRPPGAQGEHPGPAPGGRGAGP